MRPSRQMHRGKQRQPASRRECWRGKLRAHSSCCKRMEEKSGVEIARWLSATEEREREAHLRH